MSSSERIVIFVDGSGSGHSAAHFSDDEVYLTHQKGATNNEAEYNGVILALEHLPPGAKATIQSDSQLVVYQLNGRYRINYPHLSRKRETILSLIEKKKLDVRIEWIPREKNKADADIRNRHGVSNSLKAGPVKAAGDNRFQGKSGKNRP
ncbi:ribonuclease HI family protein [Methanocella sp. MCL-LM]|uniref:ribonuclease HI family protein n=1 Tax=Methanocella sp. MCL-LM TaxID=3412035 RepID=UPI003C782089